MNKITSQMCQKTTSHRSNTRLNVLVNLTNTGQSERINAQPIIQAGLAKEIFDDTIFNNED